MCAICKNTSLFVRLIYIILGLTSLCSPTSAQIQYPMVDYTMNTGISSCAYGGMGCPTSLPVDAATGINVQRVNGGVIENSGYLSVQALSQGIYNAAVGSMGQQLAAISIQMQRNVSKLSQGIALASALTIIPPNQEDRYSITFGGTAFNSQGAGSISGTAKINSNALGFVGLARSPSQTLVKGGVSFSFH